MLHSPHGMQYMETTLVELEQCTVSMDTVHTRFYALRHLLTSLNPVLYSLHEHPTKSRYWVDLVTDWSNTLFASDRTLQIDKIGASSVPLMQLADSVKTALSEALVLDATYGGMSLNLTSETTFLIRYHRAVRNLANHIKQIHNNIAEMRTEIEQLIAANNDYQITTLAQIPAIKHRSLVETKRIVQESINPRLNLTR